ncbi:MAG: 50S ribosomal protein L15e [Nitrososphaeria archaeon]|nr:50S ribosomal protein L15e [Nitrososphaeria archaeon]NIN53292.1 50S ribosomal protein L15e [Nitrososphaeria archaeon]NIQ33745.1 50S ribosomal protein L15e [Nitrososphaeria archaeon]
MRRQVELRDYYRSKRMEWRRGRTVQRVERPTRLDRARRLGYHAKQGFVVVRVKVSRGGLRKKAPTLGRRQKRTGISKIKRGKSMQKIAEERGERKYRNLKLLGSYYVGEDGRYKWFECVFVDPCHPSIKNSHEIQRRIG